MTVDVVVPCYRQERFLSRTLAGVERALAGREWSGILVVATPGTGAALPPLTGHWTVLRPEAHQPLTPGAARNLGLSRCASPWVLFLDADVELEPTWLARALAVAEHAPDALAGLWGRLEEWFLDGTAERPGARDMFRVGEAERECDFITTPVVYRAAALRAVGGYEARLNNEEDFELGLRLRAHGFRLVSLGLLTGRHWSGPRPSFAEIGRRWRTGLCFGQGQVLRLYMGRAGFGAHVRRQAHYFVTLAMWLAAVPAALLAGGPGLATWAVAPLGLLVFMTVRKRSAKLALHSLLTWTVHAAGLVVGFVQGGAPAGAPDSEATC